MHPWREALERINGRPVVTAAGGELGKSVAGGWPKTRPFPGLLNGALMHLWPGADCNGNRSASWEIESRLSKLRSLFVSNQ